MTAFLIGAGLALALALLIAIFLTRARFRTVALGPPEDLRRRRLSWPPPPSMAALLIARAHRALQRMHPKHGGRHV